MRLLACGPSMCVVAGCGAAEELGESEGGRGDDERNGGSCIDGFMTAFGDLEHNLDIPGGILSASSDLASSELSPQGVPLSLLLSLCRPKDSLSTTGETAMTDASSSSCVPRSAPPKFTFLIAPLQKQPGSCTKKSENYE